MDTRQVLLVDAFATEPLGGQPVPVVPDGDSLSTAQLRTVAGEFGADGALVLSDGGLTYAATDGPTGAVAGAVAGCVGLFEHGHVEPGTHAMVVDGAGDDGDDSTEYDLDLEPDRSVQVPVPVAPSQEPGPANEQLAAAIGVDVAAVDDVSTDLPAALVGDTLLVPVNFLEHLSRAESSTAELAGLLADAGAARLCAFTFDTIGSDADLHARFFTPATEHCERPTSGIAAAACGRHLSNHPVFDADRESVRIECGRFLDRPAAIRTTLADTPVVTGRALTALDGELTFPEDDDGDDFVVV